MATKTFEGVLDRYNGITVDSQKEPCESSDFLSKLTGKFYKKLHSSSKQEVL